MVTGETPLLALGPPILFGWAETNRKQHMETATKTTGSVRDTVSALTPGVRVLENPHEAPCAECGEVRMACYENAAGALCPRCYWTKVVPGTTGDNEA
jgi:hypothetical protein